MTAGIHCVWRNIGAPVCSFQCRPCEGYAGYLRLLEVELRMDIVSGWATARPCGQESGCA